MIDFQNVKSIVIPEGEVSIIARGAEILWKKMKLPLEYQEVEYIESSGTQYIDTGAESKATTKTNISFAITELEDAKVLFGQYQGGINFQFICYTNRFVASLGDGNGTYTPSDTNKHNVTLDGANKKAYIDNIEIPLSTTEYIGAKNPLYLFARYINGTAGNSIKAKIYFCQILDGDTIVRDFIPCYRKSDGKVGMYDLVTETFFTNAGTGEFYCEMPKYKTELAYLESTGTQYIDTKYVPNSKTAIEMVVSGISADSFAASMSGTWFIGARAAYLSKAFGFYYNPTDKKFYYAFGNAMQNASYTSLYGETRKIYADASGLYIDDAKVVFSNAGDFAAPVSLSLFGLNNNGSTISLTKYKMHFCEIWDNDNLVRDLIPVLDWNDRPCMYDKVTDELYYNQGTGEFMYA